MADLSSEFSVCAAYYGVLITQLIYASFYNISHYHKEVNRKNQLFLVVYGTTQTQ